MTVHSDLRSDELLSFNQGMGCSELGKNTFFNEHPVCLTGVIARESFSPKSDKIEMLRFQKNKIKNSACSRTITVQQKSKMKKKTSKAVEQIKERRERKSLLPLKLFKLV